MREEERLRGRKETRVQASRLNIPKNASGAQEQQLSQPQVWPKRQKVQ